MAKIIFKKQLKRKMTQHVLIWLLFVITPPFLLTPILFAVDVNLENKFYLLLFLSSVVLLIIFYINYFFLFSRFYLAKKRLQYFFYAVLMIFVVMSAFRFLDQAIAIFPEKNKVNAPGIILGILIFRVLLVFFVSSGLVLFERWELSEKEKLKAQNAFLKAQINPHFIFNTLNGIYALAIKKSDLVPDSIVQLSSILQYATNDSSKEKIPLEKEITFISDFVDLQKLRLTQKTKVHFSTDGDASQLQIEPMLLISFIENAFKYGTSTEQESSIEIAIKIVDQALELNVKNDKVRQETALSDGGIGIKNTMQRLKIAYANLHKLRIQEDEKKYLVQLNIHLI